MDDHAHDSKIPEAEKMKTAVELPAVPGVWAVRAFL